MSLIGRMLQYVSRRTEREPPAPGPVALPRPAGSAAPTRVRPVLAGEAAKPGMTGPGITNPEQQALREAFTPTRPQRSARRLAGRRTELMRIFRAIALERAHVVLYGERGRGKTSLVNLVAATSRNVGFIVGRYTCSVDSTFDDIIRGAMRDLPRSMLANPAVNDESLEGCEAALPRGPIRPRDVVTLPSRLVGRHVVLIADEFDRVADQATRTLFADTIKQGSDQGAALSLVIVGVSDSLDELLGRHPSIQRNIAGVPLPLLRDEDITEILVAGGQQAGVEFAKPVLEAICHVACGVPYIAQLLGLHAGTEATDRQSARVEPRDLWAALGRTVEEVDPRLAAIYSTITDGQREPAMLAALRSLATAEQDRFARFVVVEGRTVRGSPDRAIDPDAWQRLRDAGLVRPVPHAGPDTFTFAEPMLQHYILMRRLLDQGAADQRLSA